MSATGANGPGGGPTIEVLGPGGQRGPGRPRPVRSGAAGAAAARARMGKGKARLVQLSITAVAVLTLLLGVSVVSVAAATTGSTRPSDWTRLSWATVGDRFQACVEAGRGLGTIGCVLGIGSMRLTASEEDAWTGVERERHRIYVVETVGQVRPAVRGRAPAKPAAAPGTDAETRPHAPASTPTPGCRPVPIGDDTIAVQAPRSTCPTPMPAPTGRQPGGDS